MRRAIARSARVQQSHKRRYDVILCQVNYQQSNRFVVTNASPGKKQRTLIHHYKRESGYFTGLDMRNRV